MFTEAIETLITRLRNEPALASRFRSSLSDPAAIEARVSEIDLGVRLEDLRERLRHDAKTMTSRWWQGVCWVACTSSSRRHWPRCSTSISTNSSTTSVDGSGRSQAKPFAIESVESSGAQQILSCGAVTRCARDLAHLIEGDPSTQRGEHHRKRCRPAFGDLHLQHRGNRRAFGNLGS